MKKELRGGGMARVFLARDESLGRDVVVKVLSPELTYNFSAARFSREIKLAAALQEPHIVPVLTAGQTVGGLPYFTMPFVRGESLRERIRKGPVPVEESLSILRDVASALAYAHRQGIVHRDIKPENILLSEGTAVVTDFGIAKAVQAARKEAPQQGKRLRLLSRATTSERPCTWHPSRRPPIRRRTSVRTSMRGVSSPTS